MYFSRSAEDAFHNVHGGFLGVSPSSEVFHHSLCNLRLGPIHDTSKSTANPSIQLGLIVNLLMYHQKESIS